MDGATVYGHGHTTPSGKFLEGGLFPEFYTVDRKPECNFCVE